MTGSILWSIVLALHILSMTYWVGGGAYAALAGRSSLALLDTAQRQNVLLQLYSRYYRGLWHVIPLSLLTGWLLAIHIGGFAALPWTVNVMQLIGIIMAAIFLSAVFGPLRAARRAIRPQPTVFATIHTRIVVMVALGAITTLCASMSAM